MDRGDQPSLTASSDDGAPWGEDLDSDASTQLGGDLPASVSAVEAALQTGAADLSGQGLTRMPRCVMQASNLTELSLSDNRLAALPASLGHMRSLEGLDVSRNALSDLPAAFSNLTRLTRLALAYNRLAAVPAAVLSLTHLRELSLGDNQLAELPAALSRLTALRCLDVSYNMLARAPPCELGALAHLETLSLAGNAGLPRGWRSLDGAKATAKLREAWKLREEQGRGGGGGARADVLVLGAGDAAALDADPGALAADRQFVGDEEYDVSGGGVTLEEMRMLEGGELGGAATEVMRRSLVMLRTREVPQCSPTPHRPPSTANPRPLTARYGTASAARPHTARERQRRAEAVGGRPGTSMVHAGGRTRPSAQSSGVSRASSGASISPTPSALASMPALTFPLFASVSSISRGRARVAVGGGEHAAKRPPRWAPAGAKDPGEGRERGASDGDRGTHWVRADGAAAAVEDPPGGDEGVALALLQERSPELAAQLSALLSGAEEGGAGPSGAAGEPS
ncbi:unnamed protein product [Pedinophyceae sp. YPF-701]|nr:unnamed protein product [Pedinophyceae sp. YPF-701]